ALNARPSPDATLLHHKAIWLKRHDRPLEATAILDRALAAPKLAYTHRQEASEHIHTTYAATLLDAVSRNLLDAPDGRRKIIEHLSKARERFVNPRAVHVQARVVLKFWDLLSHSGADEFTLFNNALADIDRVMMYNNT